jgi:hypothetical protein
MTASRTSTATRALAAVLLAGIVAAAQPAMAGEIRIGQVNTTVSTPGALSGSFLSGVLRKVKDGLEQQAQEEERRQQERREEQRPQ